MREVAFEHININLDTIVNNRFEKYQRVCKSFAKFVDSDELENVLSRKADHHMID